MGMKTSEPSKTPEIIATSYKKNEAAIYQNGIHSAEPPLQRNDFQMDRMGESIHDIELTESTHIKREKWGSKWEFILSCVGLSVGIGNVWRFPYLAYANGGGAFLIPYLIMLILAGKPMYFMELAFGQFAGAGPLHVWKCAPIAKGVGIAMLTISLVVSIYYNVIMAYTLFYMFASFQYEVPWKRCGEWADERCFERSTMTFNATNNITNSTNFLGNITAENKSQPASLQYWERYVLEISDDVWNVGGIKWELALCLLLSWIIVCLCLIKGVKSSGKVVYFTATFPYVVLLILLINGLTLEGAGAGILYFIKPQWDKLLDVSVWQAAASQMFFSLSVSFGGLLIFGSYNEFKNKVHRDALAVSILDTVTSLIAGIVIFSVLGNMSHELNIPIEKVTSSGPGLAFVAYPEALSRLPLTQLWAVLFFFMLFLLGLDSEFALLETILTSIFDEFPFLRKKKLIITICVSISCYLLGLPCVTRGGQYVLNIMDEYGGGFPALFIAVSECVGLMWIYGLNRFCDDMELMLGFRPNIYWRSTWAVLSPITLLFIFIYSMATFKSLKYGSYDYPDWADGIGWLLSLLVMGQIPFWAIVMILKQKGGSITKKIKQACQPTLEWGPSDSDLQKQIEPNTKCDNGLDNVGFTKSANDIRY